DGGRGPVLGRPLRDDHGSVRPRLVDCYARRRRVAGGDGGAEQGRDGRDGRELSLSERKLALSFGLVSRFTGSAWAQPTRFLAASAVRDMRTYVRSARGDDPARRCRLLLRLRRAAR